MYNIAIVEDEQEDRERLETYLQNYGKEKGIAFTAIPIGNFGKGRPLKKRAGVA